MKGSGLRAVGVLCFVVMLPAGQPALAQDEISLGTVTAVRGGVAGVPIRVRDIEGTPLGEEYAFGQMIQGFAFQIQYEPAESVAAVSIVRSGVLYGLTPFETTRQSGNTISYLASVSEGWQRVNGLAGEGGEIAQLVVQISSAAPPGSSIALKLVPRLAMLSNTAGTVMETISQGGLKLTDGSIAISDEPGALAVSITAIKPAAAEKGKRSGKLAVVRSGDLSRALNVKLRAGGAAKKGRDYSALPKVVRFKPKKQRVVIKVKPVDDRVKEQDEEVTITVRPSGKYFVVPPGVAAVTIADND